MRGDFLALKPSDVSKTFFWVKVTSPSSQSHLQFFQVESEWRHDLVESESGHKNCHVSLSHLFASSSQCRVMWNFIFFQWLLYAMKWRPIYCNVAPDKLENSAQCCFNKFDWRLFISKFSKFALYLPLSLSVILKRLAQPCCKWCNLLVSFVLNVWFTTNGMYVNNNTHIYVVQRSRNRMSTM